MCMRLGSKSSACTADLLHCISALQDPEHRMLVVMGNGTHTMEAMARPAISVRLSGRLKLFCSAASCRTAARSPWRSGNMPGAQQRNSARAVSSGPDQLHKQQAAKGNDKAHRGGAHPLCQRDWPHKRGDAGADQLPQVHVPGRVGQRRAEHEVERLQAGKSAKSSRLHLIT
jgi:hypothetical protein